MEYMRVIKDSDEIQGVLELPPQWKNRKLEIIILPFSDSGDSTIEEFGGILSRYRREDKIIFEKDAWRKAVKERFFVSK